MSKSTALAGLLDQLTQRARSLGLSDSAWAARSGVRKETLSRLRGRHTCDFQTLCSLAHTVGVRVGLLDERIPDGTVETYFPTAIDRDYEQRLVELVASGTLDAERWAGAGSCFFMAGIAVMMASVQGLDRRGLLELAERLHPGISEPAVFERWLAASPLRPTRFLPLVSARLHHAA